MSFRRLLGLFCLLFPLSVSSALAESEGDTLTFPCSPELSPFFSQSEHTISREIDLHHWDRMQIDYWGDDTIPVDHGSLIILDDQFMLIDLHFSKDFPFSTDDCILPDAIYMVNHDPAVSDDTDPPEWHVFMYPDKDDPYAFHYACTWNMDMVGIKMYGEYTAPNGEQYDSGFSLYIDIY